MIKHTFIGKINKHFVTFEYKIVILTAYIDNITNVALNKILQNYNVCFKKF